MKTLREAVNRISSLEKEVAELKDRVHKYESREHRSSMPLIVHCALYLLSFTCWI